ncbi:MAG: NADH-quinone oxidoreductase subunit NuoF [Dehalococcoidia bacterium]|nr:NADH-quinone oxidoreductase subunit NuoF [Dehalococcoidia bacterium]MDZ4246191.1 NADH-quinone oxidoreductase subunit NuoF [Dehalococcoidia bacterium]
MTFEDIRAAAINEWDSLEKSDQVRIYLGSATCGRAAGAKTISDELEEELQKRNISAVITQVGCIGSCYLEPLVDITKPGKPRISYGNMTPKKMVELVDDYIVNDNPRPDLALGSIGEGSVEGITDFFQTPMLKSQVRIILRNCGFIDPEKINHYIARGGYSGLVRTLTMTPDQVIEELKKSGLRGRGGAGFPTGQKWEFCQRAPGNEKYIICNADEGDPGAFMNRSLLEGDPHSVLEGMVIGSHAIGASQGYIYCRAEYPLAIERLKIATDQMRKYGFLGKNIMGTGHNFEIVIKEGAGAFVCGEETALMASIEGKRGMPRPRPPFPAIAGLWGKPTNINNVETWAAAAVIMQRGWEWYSQFGTEKSKGTKTFALVGKIERTGLIEVPLGMTLRSIIYDIGGGVLDGKEFKAAQTGGPSGGCLPQSNLDSPVDYESLAAAGSIMGSGGMIVMDENTCPVDIARYFISFTQGESCGKCVPCRLGTRQMQKILQRICNGNGEQGDIEKLQKIGETVKTGSLCGLGQTAPNPVLTTIRYFRDDYEAHIHDKKCPSLTCKDLIRFYILPDKCQACLICLRNCPAEAILGGKRMIHVIDQDKCTKCGTCFDVCPKKFDAVVRVTGEKLDVPDEPVPMLAGKA